MKRLSIAVAVFGLFCFFPMAAFGQDCQVASGSWTNELGSVMILNVDSSGALTGTYQSPVGCGSGVEQPLVGFCGGYALTFSVLFQGCAATTAWAGTLNPNSSPPNIQTLFQVASGAQPQNWASITAGTNTFIPSGAVPRMSERKKKSKKAEGRR